MDPEQPCDPDGGECAVLFFRKPRPPRIDEEDFFGSSRRAAWFSLALVADSVTGGHGYTHVAIDCCDVRDTVGEPPAKRKKGQKGCDAPHGQRYAVEATLNCGVVHRTTLAHFVSADRAYGRVPISELPQLDVDCQALRTWAYSLLGQPFGFIKYLSDGALEAEGIVCVDLLTGALRKDKVKRIHRWLQAHVAPSLLSDAAAVFMRNPPGASREVSPGEYLISPNGYALAFALPHASTIDEPGVPLHPNLKPVFR